MGEFLLLTIIDEIVGKARSFTHSCTEQVHGTRYYIDYRNERPKYVEAFWKAANWDFAEKCYAVVVK